MENDIFKMENIFSLPWDLSLRSECAICQLCDLGQGAKLLSNCLLIREVYLLDTSLLKKVLSGLNTTLWEKHLTQLHAQNKMLKKYWLLLFTMHRQS